MSRAGKDGQQLDNAQRRKCAALRRELAGEHPTPLETLLVDRIVLSGLPLHYAEALYAQHLERCRLKHSFTSGACHWHRAAT